jgi:hypothetical protein
LLWIVIFSIIGVAVMGTVIFAIVYFLSKNSGLSEAAIESHLKNPLNFFSEPVKTKLGSW